MVDTVRVARAGKVHQIPGNEIQWNYRHTSFREGELLLGATLLLQPDDKDAIAARMDQAKGQRMATQPHGARSAGCFFKNAPASPVGTGKMIDELGMKGTQSRRRCRFAEACELHRYRRRRCESGRRSGFGRRNYARR